MNYKQFDYFQLKIIEQGYFQDWEDYQNKTENEQILNTISEPILSEPMLDGARPESPKYLKYKEWKEAHTGSYDMDCYDTHWSPYRDYYNEQANQVFFMEVNGSNCRDFIEMRINTHDIIRGNGGSDFIYSRWGNDIIIGGQEPVPAIDRMNGGAGDDVIVAYDMDQAYGCTGDDILFGLGDAYLEGGEDNDVFNIYNGDPSGKVPYIGDLTHEDKVDVVMINQSQFTGFHPNNDGTYVVMTSNGPGTVLNIECLDDFDIQVNQDQTRVTITGSEFI